MERKFYPTRILIIYSNDDQRERAENLFCEFAKLITTTPPKITKSSVTINNNLLEVTILDASRCKHIARLDVCYLPIEEENNVNHWKIKMPGTILKSYA